MVAGGSTDFSFKIVTCPIDEEGAEDPNYKGSLSNIVKFGEILINVADIGGWVEGIAFSPSGKRFVVNVHNNTTRYGEL